MRRLTNDDWDYESNCFVCEPRNAVGLQIPFFHDETNNAVCATFELGDAYSGAPSYVHGGLVLAVLDEAMAWAAIAVGGCWAMTGEITTRFENPILVGAGYEVTARLSALPDRDASTLSTSAEIHDGEGQVCAVASATFVILGEAQVAAAAGTRRPDTT